ncbi:MAG: lysine--tRNA ligase [Candidatus Schekmanbacteria bacterium]|nr:lysine--tRNA ligase [Candidatus Schekmanbacteria bacterium]
MTEERDPLSQQMAENLQTLRAQGIDPYPYSFPFTHTVDGIAASYRDVTDSDALAAAGPVRAPGRISTLREHGKTMFSDIRSGGEQVQLYLRQDLLGETAFKTFKVLDIGDIIGVEGALFRTRTGELTIKVGSYQLLSKCLRPLPEKWHGLTDVEVRYRQRYLDLVVNPDIRRTFETRTRLINSIRSFLNRQGYLEVETPVLQPLYGGGFAKPFVTHHNALGMRLYLRIANELYLKRLIVGGFDRVYEFARDFRNEGIDRSHNPEFTMLELYEAYADYERMLHLYEDMIVTAAQEVLGAQRIAFAGHDLDLTPPWRRWRFYDALAERTGQDWRHLSESDMQRRLPEFGLEPEAFRSKGKMLDALFGKYVEPELVQPTFVIDYPLELSPLAKNHRSEPDLVERFEPYIACMEVGNAFSELNDPAEQRRRFDEQARLREKGDEETHPMDEDFIRALEVGMPPTGGLGVGIDRIAMIFTGQTSIRDVIFFPHMRPKEGA